jgi:solute carrier family 25 uncoupling protein 8/9|eukprot:Transcript_41.p2 GENE.Transcript_41~~Transcript_41.p2  ORF type:complete len:279 (-),score=65.00 Transcript_41:43-879(-)
MPSNPGAEVLASGLGAAITDTIFNPLEMLKVRVQTSETTFPAAARSIYAQGGPWLLWTPGLQATWVRSFCVTGLRVGLYPSVKRAVSGDAPTTSFATKFAVGAATGALSASLANPIDMVRTRVHAQVGLPTRYASTAAAVLSIVQTEGGVLALWRGLGASALRQVCLSGGQLASYDTAKQAAKGAGVEEGPALHVVCAGLSGAFGQLCCMPADVIKVKVLSGDHGTSVLACLKATLRAEGVAGLFRGFVPAVCRQCPVILVQMPLIEEIRRLAGLGHI